MPYLEITSIGLTCLIPAPTPSADVNGGIRYYYVGADDNTPVVVVAIGQELVAGQVWDASFGNETGYPGFCRSNHLGMLIGKVTLRSLVNPENLKEDTQIQVLGEQIKFFKKTFIPLRRGLTRIRRNR